MPRLYALILSGGAGTRLWPLSRRRKPKQFLDLVGDRTMLQETVDRTPPAVSEAEPGAACPVCQQGRMQLIKTMYRQPAVWDLSVPAPGLDTS